MCEVPVAEDNSVDRLVQAGKPAFSKIERAKVWEDGHDGCISSKLQNIQHIFCKTPHGILTSYSSRLLPIIRANFAPILLHQNVGSKWLRMESWVCGHSFPAGAWGPRVRHASLQIFLTWARLDGVAWLQKVDFVWRFRKPDWQVVFESWVLLRYVNLGFAKTMRNVYWTTKNRHRNKGKQLQLWMSSSWHKVR